MRSGKELLEIFRDAFRPLRCDAEIYDYGQKLRFRIYDLQGQQIKPDRICILGRLQASDSELQLRVEDARDNSEMHTKIKLDPWSLPSAKP